MDLTAPFKTEVLRPVTTLVVPGIIAVGPFVLILGHYIPGVADFWRDHSHAFAVLLILSVLAAGFIIDDLSLMIESLVWDRLLDQKNCNHHEDWRCYLKLKVSDEYVAQRYIRTKVTQLKFELAMVPALLIFGVGLAWLQYIFNFREWRHVLLMEGALIVGAAYLLWESWKTANVLSNARALLLDAMNARTKRCCSEIRFESAKPISPCSGG